jgi:hypothetical protein
MRECFVKRKAGVMRLAEVVRASSPVIHAQDPRASFKLPAGVYLARYSRRDLTETSGRFTFTDSA